MLRGEKAMAGVHAKNARTNNSRAEIFIQNMNIYMYTHINFQEYSYLDIEDTYASDHKKSIFPLFFWFIFQLSNSHQNYAKMPNNLTSNMVLYFREFIHFSRASSYISNQTCNDFTSDLILSLILFDHHTILLGG